MQIDWGQIVTHILGFVLAVWLLRKYAWGKILDYVEGRRERIASDFASIERGKADVEAQKARYQQELDGIESLRRQKIQEAANEAQRLANEIKEEARQEAIEMRAKAEQDIANELDKANEAFKDRIIDAVVFTAEKMIKESLDREKHAKLIDDYLAEVKVR